MAFHREDEVRLHLENWVAWSGDSPSAIYGGCTLAWSPSTAEERAMRRSSGFVANGADAQLTGQTLDAIGNNSKSYMLCYHLKSGEVQGVAEEMHCHRNTASTTLRRAHEQYWDHRAAILLKQNQAAKILKALHAPPETPRQS